MDVTTEEIGRLIKLRNDIANSLTQHTGQHFEGATRPLTFRGLGIDHADPQLEHFFQQLYQKVPQSEQLVGASRRSHHSSPP
jgi:hypothetical protein